MTNYQMKKYIPYFLIIVGVVVFYWARYIRAPHVTFTEQLVDNSNPGADAIGDITGPAIVHFYASWCGPCMSEMKELNNLIPDYEKNGIQFVLPHSCFNNASVQAQLRQHVGLTKFADSFPNHLVLVAVRNRALLKRTWGVPIV